jgi:hypothetical protein
VKDLYQILVEEVPTEEIPTANDDRIAIADKKKVDAIINNKKLPEKAEKGKTFRILWADGRATWNVSSKSALRSWARNASEIVWIRYEDSKK